MRHVLFAIVLVGASFLGGAFVNGPGLKWLQVQVLGHAGLGEEVPSLTPPAAVASGSEGDPGPGGNPPPAENPAPKINVPSSPKIAAGAPRPEPEPASGSKSGLSNVLGSLLSLGDAATAEQSTPATSPAKNTKPSKNSKEKPPLPEPAKPTAVAQAAPMPRDPERPAPLDPSVTPAFLASLTSPSSGSDSGSGPSGPKVPVARASATSDPTPLPLPIPVPHDDNAFGRPPMSPEPASGADDWGTIRRKLQTLGVTRYTIEGEPGGRVSFSCLIPLAGRQAVTQRFEAEGDDEIRAARAALRRIVLWQATERERSAR